MKKKYDILNLINKQYSGQISDEELVFLKKWYDENTENQKQYKDYYARLKHARIIENKARFEPFIVVAYQKFIKKTQVLTKTRSNKIMPSVWLHYAAIFIIAFGLGILSYNYYTDTGTVFESHTLAQTIEIPFGSKSKITLPDGTSVWLNSGSILSYGEDFGKSNRDITLDGEGFFDVMKNESLPFQVISGDVKIKVLGTKFNFKSYEEDESSRVTLVEGSLTVSGDKDKKDVLLIPNQQAVINKKREKLTVKNVDAQSYMVWTEPKSEVIDVTENVSTGQINASIRTPNVILRNILFFDEEPLGQIARDLERVFNVNIVIKDQSLLNEHFYGDFRNEESIAQILDIMSKSNQLEYQIVEDNIIISKK